MVGAWILIINLSYVNNKLFQNLFSLKIGKLILIFDKINISFNDSSILILVT